MPVYPASVTGHRTHVYICILSIVRAIVVYPVHDTGMPIVRRQVACSGGHMGDIPLNLQFAEARASQAKPSPAQPSPRLGQL